MRSLVAICVCTLLLVTGNSALPYGTADIEEFLNARLSQVNGDSCNQDLNIVNGVAIYDVTPSTEGTTATFRCNDGFEPAMTFPPNVCQFSQSEGGLVWTGRFPICVGPCPNLNIDNGDVTYSRTPHGLGSTASFECEETHNLEGEDSLTCEYDATSRTSRWSGNPPTCTIKPCQQNLNIDNGVVTYDATPSIPGTTATYTCNGDRELHGGDLRPVCRFNQAEGRPVWSGVPPICVAPCPQNLNIGNGDVTYTRTPSRLGSTANFVCDANHDLTGEDSLTCEFDPLSNTARWSGNPPTCTRICNQDLNVVNGVAIYAVTPSIEDSTATFRCNDGFEPAMTFPPNVCQFSQSEGRLVWTGRFPICVAPCPQNLNIGNGDVTYSRTPSRLGSTANFVCDANHDLTGEDSLTCEFDPISNTAQWSGNPPTCTRICNQDLTVVNGVAIYDVTPSTEGTEATFRCNDGFEPGRTFPPNVCQFSQSEGRLVWTGRFPICVGPCRDLNIDNGDVTYSRTPHGLGSTASFECEETHNLEGEDSLTCEYDENSMRSRWSGDPPTCTIKPCQQNLNIDNGVVTYDASPSIPGTTATYTCNGDNELHGGDPRPVCRFSQAEGRPVWSGVPPICVAPCPQNLNIGNGDVTYTRTPSRLGSTANFVCDANHDLTGEDSLTCEFDPISNTARWSGNPPTCTPSGCSDLPELKNGNIRYSSPRRPRTASSTANYECDDGFILVTQDIPVIALRDFERTCQNDGSWSGGPAPVCTRACPRLSGTIQNGFIQPPNNRDVIRDGRGVILGWRVNSVAQYDCNPGFELVAENGIIARVCQNTGRWTRNTASCKAISTECPRLGKNVALDDDDRYREQIRTLIKAGFGTKTTEPFATRTQFTGYQEGDRYTLTCVNGWNPESGPGFEVCQRNENTGLMEWSRTNVCFFRYAGGSLNAQPIRE